MDVKEFINSCKTEEEAIVVQKFLIEGGSYFFSIIEEKHEEFFFKRNIAVSLGVHLRDIVIVGSGKLGFSIKPERENEQISSPLYYPFRKFDEKRLHDPNEEPSDLDVAIISENLFDQQLLQLYIHTKGYKHLYYKLPDFAKYILKGWIRPDLAPNSYRISENLDDICKKYKSKYGRKINFGIYKSWFYFENYHVKNIRSIKNTYIAVQ